MQTGALIISLDLELHWGVRDQLSVTQYRDNLLGEREAVSALLSVFARRNIRATWATVGMLLAENKRELMTLLPDTQPQYADATLSPYPYLAQIGDSELSDPVHYAPSLIRQIVAIKGQELASHTFSHYYCLEHGQTAADFDADLGAMTKACSRFGSCTSLVFPRNQYNPAYRPLLSKHGIRAFRSNPNHWAYSARTARAETLVHRAARLVDTYLPLSGDLTRTVVRGEDDLVDVPASVFLRPWSRRSRTLQRLQISRIHNEMERAARERRMFHLWWHPHNFGTNLRDNLDILDAILERFDTLRRKVDMQTWTMSDAATHALSAK